MLADLGLDTSRASPMLLTAEIVAATDLAITQGSGESCQYVLGARYRDWPLDGPRGRDQDEVRPTVADIDRRVRELPDELAPTWSCPRA